jgi:release factor glutamine methyltransferase
VAADDEAALLVRRAGGDPALLDALVARRLTGEPLAWICGSTTFCGVEVRVDPGVYVPRSHSEPLARQAAARLPEGGTVLDVCCGSGAIALAVARARPGARVVATDVDERAVACARANGVEVYAGDLFDPVPQELVGHLDVVVGVVPYVPTSALGLLQRDTFAFESAGPYDGGPDGGAILRRVAAEARPVLVEGGTLLLELGGDQFGPLAEHLEALGYRVATPMVDDEGDVRGIEATWASHRRRENVF